MHRVLIIEDQRSGGQRRRHHCDQRLQADAEDDRQRPTALAHLRDQHGGHRCDGVRDGPSVLGGRSPCLDHPHAAPGPLIQEARQAAGNRCLCRRRNRSRGWGDCRSTDRPRPPDDLWDGVVARHAESPDPARDGDSALEIQEVAGARHRRRRRPNRVGGLPFARTALDRSDQSSTTGCPRAKGTASWAAPQGGGVPSVAGCFGWVCSALSRRPTSCATRCNRR